MNTIRPSNRPSTANPAAISFWYWPGMMGILLRIGSLGSCLRVSEAMLSNRIGTKYFEMVFRNLCTRKMLSAGLTPELSRLAKRVRLE
jgi:hypothetical protein